VHCIKPETPIGIGASSCRRSVKSIPVLVLLVMTSALLIGPFVRSARADTVGNLKAQATTISHELIQEQLEAGAYQQQYSVATERVAADQRAIAETQVRISSDRRQIATRSRDVRRLVVMSYVLNGTVSSTSGAALLTENVETVQSANEYATISVGNLNLALDQLHTAIHAVQAQQETLLQQRTVDESVQTHQAAYLEQANATTQHMEDVQAQVTGQLAAAVVQQNAAEAAAAAAAVASAQRATAQATDVDLSNNTVDPALNPFLQCVVQAESGGNYAAVSPNGEYMGAFQFDQPTWNYAAQAAGRNDLVGVPPNTASKADQDTVAVALYSLDGERPWLGDRCSST